MATLLLTSVFCNKLSSDRTCLRALLFAKSLAVVHLLAVMCYKPAKKCLLKIISLCTSFKEKVQIKVERPSFKILNKSVVI